jgi:hypothetical protein
MRKLILAFVFVLPICPRIHADIIKLESPSLTAEVDDTTGRWALLDKRSGTQWPTRGVASPGTATGMEGGLQKIETLDKTSVRLHWKTGSSMVLALTDEGKALELRYEGKEDRPVRTSDDFSITVMRFTIVLRQHASIAYPSPRPLIRTFPLALLINSRWSRFSAGVSDITTISLYISLV